MLGKDWRGEGGWGVQGGGGGVGGCFKILHGLDWDPAPPPFPLHSTYSAVRPKYIYITQNPLKGIVRKNWPKRNRTIHVLSEN